ncbi:MAG: hypothetical protein LJE56_06310 [Acidiferrobacterales bacterium]|jgi:hypothetical protein|nr:hypothetical protein [Acidiferrobacterales bacterium]
MDKYWFYFKQGWWAQLVMFIFQVALVVALLPIALLFYNDKIFYYSFVVLIFIFVLVPFGGWLFAKYSGKFGATE